MPLSRGRAEDIFIGFVLIFLIIGVVIGWVLPVQKTYSLNFAPKASGPTASNQAVPQNTNFCSGITAGPLTTTGTHQIEVTFTWLLASLNVTGEVFNPSFQIGTNVPATVFQSGLCASGGTTVGIMGIYAAVAGSAFQFSASGVYSVSKVAGTYYCWLNFQAKSTPVLMTSFGTLSSITMLEIK